MKGTLIALYALSLSLSQLNAQWTTPVEMSKPVEISKPVEMSKKVVLSRPVSLSKPVTLSKPIDSISKPVVLSKAVDSMSKPVNLSSPVELSKPVDLSKPGDLSHTVDPSRPVNLSKPADLSNPVELSKPVNVSKPVDLSKPVALSKPVDANNSYTKGASVEIKNIFKNTKELNVLFAYMTYTNTELLHEHIYFSDGTNIGWEKAGLFTYDSKPKNFSLRQDGYDELIMKYSIMQIISEDKLFERRYSLVGNEDVDRKIVGVNMTDNRKFMDKYNCQDFVEQVLIRYNLIKGSHVNMKLDANHINSEFKKILNIISHDDPL